MPALSGDLQIRARFLLPKAPGNRVIVCDRDDVTGENRVRGWGQVVQLISGDSDTATLTISNLPMAETTVGSGRFSDYWSIARPPDGSAVTIDFRTSSTADWEQGFVGAISEVSRITEQEVVISLGGQDERLYRDIGDVIARAEYPQAEESAIDTIKPIILGEVQKFPPPQTRERKSAILKESILAATAINSGATKTVKVDDNTGWPDSGTLKIGDEVFGFNQTTLTDDTDDEIRLISRAQEGTTAQTHSSGDGMLERAKAKWIVAGHECASISDVFGVTSNGETVLLDPANYTTDLGQISGEASVELNSDDGLKITAPGENSVYRRVEMDTDTLKGSVSASAHLPVGFPAADGDAKNAALAAADAGSWGENTYAIMRKGDAATLGLYRSDPVDIPPIQPSRVFLAVEHTGMEEFAKLGELTEELGDDALSDIIVKFDNQSNEDMGTETYIAVDDEWMKVAPGGSGPAGVTLEPTGRGALGTSVASHGEGAIVRLVRNHPSVGDGRVEMPQVHVFLESDPHLQLGAAGHTFTEVGKLKVGSDVPADVAEQEGYTEGASLTTWHGHVVDGLPVYGKTENDNDIGFAHDKFQYPTWLGDVLVGTVKNVNQLTAGNPDKLTQQMLPLSSTGAGGITPGEGGWLVHFSPNQTALAASMNQRVVELRVRLAVSSTDGSNNTVRTRCWISTAGDNGVPQLVLDESDGIDVSLSYQNPTTSTSYKVAFTEANGFPDGVRMARLLSKDFAVLINAPDGGIRLHHAAIDLRFQQQQLAGGSGDDEFLNDRSIHIVPPMVAVADGTSTFDNSTDAGPDGTGGYGGSKMIHVLATDFHNQYLTKDTTSNFLARDIQGNRTGLVRFTQSPTGDRDVFRCSLHFPAYVTHGKARVFRISLLMRVAAREDTVPPIVWIAPTASGGDNYAPSSTSAGPLTNFDSDAHGIGGRLWRWTWNFSGPNQNIKAKDLHQMRVTIQSAGDHNDDEEWYSDFGSFHIETNDPRSNSAQTVKAEQFTRVNYFDVTEQVSSPDDVQNLGVVLSMAKDLYDPDLITAFGNQKVISKDYKFQPIFVHRVWWVFEQRSSDEQEVTRIAVDVDGISLIPGFEGATAIQKVLTSGPPLLDYSPATNFLNTGSFVSATTAGMHKLRGVIQQRIGARELLNKLCEQARVWGFWEDGVFRVLYKHDPSVIGQGVARVVFDYDQGHILDDSVELSPRPKNSVTTRVSINARPDYVKGGFKIDAAAKAPVAEQEIGTILGPHKIDADFIWTQAEADSLAEQQIDYRRLPEVILRFQTSLFQVARDLRRGDLVELHNHALVDAGDTFQVVGINRSFGTLSSGIPVYEIEAVQRILTSDVEILGK